MLLRLVHIGTFAILTGCAAAGTDGDTPDRAAVDSLRVRVDSLEAQLLDAKLDIGFQKLRDGARHVAYLTPGSDGYSSVSADIGTLTFTIANVQPYASGSRVSLRIGNPTAAQIDGLSFEADWGKTDSAGGPIPGKSREVKLETSLRNGSWTTVPIVLEGTPPGELGYIRLRNITHASIQLLR